MHIRLGIDDLQGRKWLFDCSIRSLEIIVATAITSALQTYLSYLLDMIADCVRYRRAVVIVQQGEETVMKRVRDRFV